MEPRYLSESFSDLHKLESRLYRWDIILKKISFGNFHGILNTINLGDVQYMDARFSGTIFQKGLIPDGYVTIAFPAIDSTPFWWYFRKVHSDSLLIFPESQVLNAISHDGFHVQIISIRKPYLESLLKLPEYFNLQGQLMGEEKIISVGKRVIFPLNILLQEMLMKVQVDPNLIQSKELRNNLRLKVPELLLGAISNSIIDGAVPIKRSRDQSLSSAIEYILTQDLTTLSIADITASTGIKPRTLEYAFKEYFQVGPKRFIKALRLNEFRHDLLKKGNSISDTASRHGFDHLSQLSQDYRLLFGELPRETLKKHRKEYGISP